MRPTTHYTHMRSTCAYRTIKHAQDSFLLKFLSFSFIWCPLLWKYALDDLINNQSFHSSLCFVLFLGKELVDAFTSHGLFFLLIQLIRTVFSLPRSPLYENLIWWKHHFFFVFLLIKCNTKSIRKHVQYKVTTKCFFHPSEQVLLSIWTKWFQKDFSRQCIMYWHLQCLRGNNKRLFSDDIILPGEWLTWIFVK